MGRPTLSNTPKRSTQSPQDEAVAAFIANASGQVSDRTIALFGDVCEQSVAQAIQQLLTLGNQNNNPIHMIISTFGGGMLDMFGLIDVMKMLRAPVCTVGIGKVMSAGTCILAAGAKGKRMCGRTTRIMIHQCHGGASGTVLEILNEIDEMKVMQDLMVNTLVNNTKMTNEQIIEIMSRKVDVYFSAEQAVELGIVDKIIG